MSIFDSFGGFLIGAIIDPASSYEEMKDKIETNNEETINDCESIDPEDNFNSLVMDIKNDFDDDSDADDTEGINSVDADLD